MARRQISVVMKDAQAVEDIIRGLPEATGAMLEVAGILSDTARRSSPVDQRQYIAEHVTGSDGPGTAWYGNSETDAHLVEFGSPHGPAHRTLTRAAESNGLRFDPDGGNR